MASGIATRSVDGPGPPARTCACSTRHGTDDGVRRTGGGGRGVEEHLRDVWHRLLPRRVHRHGLKHGPPSTVFRASRPTVRPGPRHRPGPHAPALPDGRTQWVPRAGRSGAERVTPRSPPASDDVAGCSSWPWSRLPTTSTVLTTARSGRVVGMCLQWVSSETALFPDGRRSATTPRRSCFPALVCAGPDVRRPGPGRRAGPHARRRRSTDLPGDLRYLPSGFGVAFGAPPRTPSAGAAMVPGAEPVQRAGAATDVLRWAAASSSASTPADRGADPAAGAQGRWVSWA